MSSWNTSYSWRFSLVSDSPAVVVSGTGPLSDSELLIDVCPLHATSDPRPADTLPQPILSPGTSSRPSPVARPHGPLLLHILTALSCCTSSRPSPVARPHGPFLLHVLTTLSCCTSSRPSPVARTRGSLLLHVLTALSCCS